MKRFFSLILLMQSLTLTIKAQNTFPASGNVGIGTTSPVYPLHVVGSVGATDYVGGGLTLVPNDGFTYNNMFIEYYGLRWKADPWTGNPNVSTTWGPTAMISGFGGIKFFTLNSFKMALDVNGRLGLGTQAPTTPLEVAYADNGYGMGINVTNSSTGTSTLSGYSISNSNNGRVGQFVYVPANYINPPMRNTVQISSVGNVGLSFVASADAAATPDIFFQSGGNPAAMYIVGSTGHVGIGTTTPGSYALAVNGDLAAKRIKVTQGNGTTWPDYVFESDYPLQPLDSVESYIRFHKHLPGVISASEVKKDGIDIVDNQTAMLKKIEELTLYVIELKKEQLKQNSTNQKKIAEMMSKIELLENKGNAKQ